MKKKQYIEDDNSNNLFKLIIKCLRNQNEPDLHSFTIKTKNGVAFVDCRSGEVYIESHYGESKQMFCGTAVAATNRLLNLGADYESVEI